jgi:hypothetical protein
MVQYVFGLVLQVIGLGVTLIAAIDFFNPSFGMGKLLQLSLAGVAAFYAGHYLMRPFRGGSR